MQNVTLHKGALRHPSFGVCMCAPGTVLQENSNTSEIFWDLLRTSQVCFSRDMSWPGYGWSLTRAAALVAWLTLSVNPLVKLWLHPINQNWEKAKKTKKENEEKRAEDDHISFEIFSQKMPEILKWCLCGNTHCTPSVVLLAFWIGQIVFPTSEYLCPELCHNDQLLMTSGKTLVNFSLCDSLWFFVILCAFSILFSTLCEMRREGVLWTSLWGREGDFCSRVERCEPRDRCGLLRSLPEAVAIPPPGRRRQQWRQEFLWSLEDQACYIGISKTH